MGVIDRLTPKSPEYKRETTYIPLSRLAFAVGKVNVKATRNIIEVLTLLISRQRLNGIIRQRSAPSESRSLSKASSLSNISDTPFQLPYSNKRAYKSVCFKQNPKSAPTRNAAYIRLTAFIRLFRSVCVSPFHPLTRRFRVPLMKSPRSADVILCASIALTRSAYCSALIARSAVS